MRVGFTGTRRGMDQRQQDMLAFVLSVFGIHTGQEFHYGGHTDVPLLADTQAAAVAVRLGFKPHEHMASRGDELERNKAIVRRSDILIAAPDVDDEQWRGSGTWATIRYAQTKRIPVVMLPRGQRGAKR